MRLMLRNRFMAAGEKVGHHRYMVREPGTWAHGQPSVPQPTRPGLLGFTGAGAQRFQKVELLQGLAMALQRGGGQPWPGGGAFRWRGFVTSSDTYV